MRGGGFGRVVATAVVITTAIVGVTLTNSGGGDPIPANLFLAPSGGSSGCVRSSTLLTYAEAVSANAVCNTFDVACSAATGGDIIGVKNGTYAIDEPSRGAIWMNNGDCSDGLGANTNPNGSSIPSNWVSFQCGDGEGTPSSVTFAAGHFDINAKLHAEFRGACFYINNIHAGAGDATLTSQYVRFNGVKFYGFECIGCSDFAFLNTEQGPEIFCAQDGNPSYPEQEECQTNGPIWESRWANVSGGSTGGSADKVGMQNYLHQNTGGIGANNISYINHYAHDIQTKNSDPVGFHAGCIQTEKATGLLIDRSKFERCVLEPLLFNDPYTLTDATIQNSMIGCNTDGVDVAADSYDQVATGSVKTIDNSSNLTNVLIRYNTFCSQAVFPEAETYTNVRVIGNLFLATGTDCSVTGMTFDYNAVVGGTCGTNSTNVSAGLVVNRGVTDNNCVPNASSLTDFCGENMDHHLTGSTVTGVDNAVTPTSSDYALTYDYDNGSRTSGSRDVGADER
jgi:hypothetical protein